MIALLHESCWKAFVFEAKCYKQNIATIELQKLCIKLATFEIGKYVTNAREKVTKYFSESI